MKTIDEIIIWASDKDFSEPTNFKIQEYLAAKGIEGVEFYSTTRFAECSFKDFCEWFEDRDDKDDIKPFPDSILSMVKELRMVSITYQRNNTHADNTDILSLLLNYYDCYLQINTLAGKVFLMKGNFENGKAINMPKDMEHDIIYLFDYFTKVFPKAPKASPKSGKCIGLWNRLTKNTIK